MSRTGQIIIAFDFSTVTAELTAMADRLEIIMNELADRRDLLPPHHPDKAPMRKLGKMAEKAMKALDKEGITK